LSSSIAGSKTGSVYGETPEAQKRYSPAQCIGARKTRIEGDPDPSHISTSYAERQNLTMRMHMRRFTRLTNAFSKKFENHMHMVALYTVWYNYVKQHKSLKGPFAGDGRWHQPDPLEHDGPCRDDRRQLAEAWPAGSLQTRRRCCQLRRPSFP